MTRTITVVNGGLSETSSTRRLADQLGAATTEALRARGVAAEVTTVDLRERAHAITDATLTGFAAQALQEDIDRVLASDGVIAATPVYSGSYTGLFKSFVDLLGQAAFDGTPVLLAATAGTARHSLALEHAMRPLFSYLRALTVPTGVFAASEDWGGDGDAAGALAGRVRRAADELADLVVAREPKRVVDEFASAPSFSDLLGDLRR
ncbi:CE1759 family FMN reductase [Aquipuribacter hungaricus]|uniref:CE1759 family FMN reductase n=1 Tax=Aquipuribacter hungaricus TaxID=545624 RepID=A0ABV7WIJ4_9MICO